MPSRPSVERDVGDDAGAVGHAARSSRSGAAGQARLEQRLASRGGLACQARASVAVAARERRAGVAAGGAIASSIAARSASRLAR